MFDIHAKGTSVKRTVLATIAGLLAIGAPLGAFAAPVGGYAVDAAPVQYDRAANRTTYTYTVKGDGSDKDLSHFTLELADCFGAVAAASPAEAFSLGLDPTTGIRGLKWDQPLRNDATRTYSFTLEGLWAPTEITAAVKAGNGFKSAELTGPSCAPADPKLSVVKTAGAAPDGQTLVTREGEVAFTYVVTNTGNMPLATGVVDDNGTPADAGDDFVVGTPDLAPGASATLTWALPLKDDHTNRATATGTVAPGWQVEATDDASVDVIHPSIALAAACPPSAYYGKPAEYRVTVKNTGDVALSGVSVAGGVLGGVFSGDLAVGEEKSVAVPYAAPAGAASPMTSAVEATGLDTIGLPVGAAAACQVVLSEEPTVQTPAIEGPKLQEAKKPSQPSKPAPAAPTAAAEAHTIGYWKNHAWPVQSIQIGGRTLSRAQGLVVLKEADAKDATKQLAAQLVGSKLNVLAGAEHACIDGAIARADAFLASSWIGSNPKGAARDAALAIKDQLDAYNNHGCA
jgi:hypothetical protein